MKDWFGSNTTMYKARDSLYKAGFIVINAYGGRSVNGMKLPHLYALTWATIDELNENNNLMRFTHYSTKKTPLNPIIRANHLLKPIFALRKIIERIVIKNGLTKNKVTAIASDNLVKEKKYKQKARKNSIPLIVVKRG